MDRIVIITSDVFLAFDNVLKIAKIFVDHSYPKLPSLPMLQGEEVNQEMGTPLQVMPSHSPEPEQIQEPAHSTGHNELGRQA